MQQSFCVSRQFLGGGGRVAGIFARGELAVRSEDY